MKAKKPAGLPYVNIDVLDRPRKIKYDYNAMSDAEATMNMGIAEIFAAERLGFRVARNMLWAGLKWEDKTLRLEQVGDMLQAYMLGGGSIADISSLIIQGIAASGLFRSAGSEEDDDEGNGKAEAGK